MLYYEVKSKFDQKKRIDGNIFIAHELYTVTESRKYKIKSEYIQEVNYNQRNSYWMFGARFNSEQNEKRGL